MPENVHQRLAHDPYDLRLGKRQEHGQSRPGCELDGQPEPVREVRDLVPQDLGQRDGNGVVARPQRRHGGARVGQRRVERIDQLTHQQGSLGPAPRHRLQATGLELGQPQVLSQPIVHLARQPVTLGQGRLPARKREGELAARRRGLGTAQLGHVADVEHELLDRAGQPEPRREPELDPAGRPVREAPIDLAQPRPSRGGGLKDGRERGRLEDSVQHLESRSPHEVGRFHA